MPTGRTGALADGVFAIVMTLIVFELNLPEDADSVADGLRELSTALLTFIISFVILGQYWVAHHNQMAYVQQVDQAFLWLNITYLMGVSLVPFSARLLGTYNDDVLAAVVYSANLCFISFCHYLIWHYATSKDATDKRRLVDNAMPPEVVRLGMELSLLPIAFYVVATVCAFFSIIIAYIVYAVVPAWVIFTLVLRLQTDTGQERQA